MKIFKSSCITIALASLIGCSAAPDENQVLYDEYHQIMCRDKAGERTLDDARRQGELNKIILDKVAPGMKFPSAEARENHMKRFAAATDTATCVIKPRSPEAQSNYDAKIKEIQALVDEVHQISCKEKDKTATPNERLHKIELSNAIMQHEMMTRNAMEWSSKSLKAQNPDDCGAPAEAAAASAAPGREENSAAHGAQSVPNSTSKESAAETAAPRTPASEQVQSGVRESSPAPTPSAGGTLPVASFDCAKAASPAERLICSSPELGKADQTLAASFKEARARSANPDGLKAEQLNWLKSKRNACTDAQCMLTTINARIEELRSK